MSLAFHTHLSGLSPDVLDQPLAAAVLYTLSPEASWRRAALDPTEGL